MFRRAFGLLRSWLNWHPKFPINRFRKFFRFTPFQHGSLNPDEEVFLKILELPRHSGRTQLNFLETRLSYFPVFKISEGESSWIKRFASMQDLHPTWAVYKCVAKFLEEPTKECLARELRNVAESVGHRTEYSDTGMAPLRSVADLGMFGNVQRRVGSIGDC